MSNAAEYNPTDYLSNAFATLMAVLNEIQNLPDPEDVTHGSVPQLMDKIKVHLSWLSPDSIDHLAGHLTDLRLMLVAYLRYLGVPWPVIAEHLRMSEQAIFKAYKRRAGVLGLPSLLEIREGFLPAILFDSVIGPPQ